MKYRDLSRGDVLQAGDEYKTCDGSWSPVPETRYQKRFSFDVHPRHRRPILEDKYGTRIQDGDEYEVSAGVWEKVHPDSVGLPQSLFTNYRRPPLDTRSEEDVQSEWISVADALPDDIDDVLLLRKDSDLVCSGWYDETKGWFRYSGSGEEIVDDVTHWHPAPPLPELKPTVDPDEEAFVKFSKGFTESEKLCTRAAFQAALAYARKERE